MTRSINKNKWDIFKNKATNSMSKLSKAFMLPIAILPAAGLLLGIGGAIGANTSSEGALQFAKFLKGMSEVVFANLPIIFAASMAMAFTKINAVSAVFMTIIAYIVFSGVQNAFIHYENKGGEKVFKDIFYLHTNNSLKYMVGTNLGIVSMQTSIFGGLVIGGLTSYVLNRWSEIQLPNALSFFSGIRLVPMLLLPIAAATSILFLLLWPFVGTAISFIGTKSNDAPGGIDGLAYGMLGRSLMPFGLHHVVIGMAWQSDLGGSLKGNDVMTAATKLGVQNTSEIKEFISVIGNKTIVGDQNIWNTLNGLNFNRIPTNLTGGSLPVFEWATKYLNQYPGRFMQDYPIYIGACMGIGAAIIASADKDKRKKVAAITGSAMAVALLTGITEPLEFSFLFVAPLFYYIIYVPLSGLAYMLMKISGAHVGVGFARGLIDLIIYGTVPIQKGTQFWWAFVYAAAFAPFSFFTFYFMIKKFNWATPGRNGNNVGLISKADYKKMTKDKNIKGNDEIKSIIEAYGGIENLEHVTACATRLRITVKDERKVNKDTIINLGASGFIKRGKASQAIFGGKAAILANKINDLYGDKIGK